MIHDGVVVVSAYKPRGFQRLNEVMSQLAGRCDRVVVVNDDSANTTTLHQEETFKVINRPNTGMNIGAWSAAIPYVHGYRTVIFIQDECFLRDVNFLSIYTEKLSQSGVGMVGESINPKWNCSWESMENSPLNYAFSDRDRNSVRRVAFYRQKMLEWKIDPGVSAKHLRALAWGFSKETLEILRGFPIGHTKEECIAAEIAVSKKVEQLGLRVEQISIEHFKCFGHVEWRIDGASKA